MSQLRGKIPKTTLRHDQQEGHLAGSSLSTFRDGLVKLIIHPVGGQHSERPLDLLTQTLLDDK